MIRQLRELGEKTELSGRLRSALLASVDNEVHIPLNAIASFSELIVIYDNPEEKREYIDIIQSSNELLLRLINDVLGLSKIEPDITECRRKNFNLARICNKLFVTTQTKMANPGVESRLDGPNLEYWILLNRNRLKQV